MKIRQTISFAWVEDESTRQDIFVVIDSKPIDDDAVYRAHSILQAHEGRRDFLPTVFLDPALDTPERCAAFQAAALDRALSASPAPRLATRA